jgi:hypothetical protein
MIPGRNGITGTCTEKIVPYHHKDHDLTTYYRRKHIPIRPVCMLNEGKLQTVDPMLSLYPTFRNLILIPRDI